MYYVCIKQGAEPGFSFGGGGGGVKIMCADARTSRARSPKSLTAGVQTALAALKVFDALSYYLSLIFKHSDTKWDLKNIVDFFFGGGGG